MLCVKGADSVKSYTRFATIDAPERGVTYLADDVGLDAISFVPQQDITFLGFSVYPVFTVEDEFTCHWKMLIGEKQYPN